MDECTYCAQSERMHTRSRGAQGTGHRTVCDSLHPSPFPPSTHQRIDTSPHHHSPTPRVGLSARVLPKFRLGHGVCCVSFQRIHHTTISSNTLELPSPSPSLALSRALCHALARYRFSALRWRALASLSHGQRPFLPFPRGGMCVFDRTPLPAGSRCCMAPTCAPAGGTVDDDRASQVSRVARLP